MTHSEQIRIVAERIRDLFGAPDTMEWVTVMRRRSAAQIRFISDALEQVDQVEPQDDVDSPK